MNRQPLTVEELKRAYRYDPETGFFHATTNRPRRKAGDVCGIVTRDWGYIEISVRGRKILAHRAAWLYVHGCHAPSEIDHINGIKTDNRIANLRTVSSSVNAENKRKARADNVCGLLGVSPLRGGFRSVIHIRGRQKYIGWFTTPEAAHEAYLAAKRLHHEGNTL